MVGLYPSSFRNRFGDEILQTFSDLTNEFEREGRNILLLTVSSLYDASVGVAAEWLNIMTAFVLRSKRTTVLAFVLCLPFITLLAITLSAPLLSLLTIDGQQLNGIGRFVVFGGILLLPIAFVLNLMSLLPTRNTDGTLAFRPHLSGAALGIGLLLTLGWIGIWMVGEAVNCSRGICD